MRDTIFVLLPKIRPLFSPLKIRLPKICHPEDHQPKKPRVRLSAAVERLREAALEFEGAGGSFKVCCVVLCHLNLLTLPKDFDALPAARATQLLITLKQEKAPSVQTHYCKLLRNCFARRVCGHHSFFGP
jgi:hypothetical protein